MPEPAAKTSQRFSRAAKAERNRLARKQGQLKERRQSLQEKINELDDELEAVEERICLIEAVAEPGETAQVTEIAPRAGEGTILSGAAIREQAIPLLLRDRGSSPVHYREWLELLNQHGYQVAGKRPDAVFLNQVTRSPVVHATTKSGYYELDLGAVERLRGSLSKQVAELAECSQGPTSPADFEQRRKHQRELSSSIARTERALEEATRALAALDDQGPAVQAA
jgi:hypothetical protein